MHIITWILEKQSRLHKIRPTKFRAKRNADELIKYCRSCNPTWEHIRPGNNKKSIARYENLPTYGKRKELCPRCKDNEINN